MACETLTSKSIYWLSYKFGSTVRSISEKFLVGGSEGKEPYWSPFSLISAWLQDSETIVWEMRHRAQDKVINYARELFKSTRCKQESTHTKYSRQIIERCSLHSSMSIVQCRPSNVLVAMHIITVLIPRWPPMRAPTITTGSRDVYRILYVRMPCLTRLSFVHIRFRKAWLSNTREKAFVVVGSC